MIFSLNLIPYNDLYLKKFVNLNFNGLFYTCTDEKLPSDLLCHRFNCLQIPPSRAYDPVCYPHESFEVLPQLNSRGGQSKRTQLENGCGRKCHETTDSSLPV